MILGPMMGGKTSIAKTRIRRWKENGGKVVAFVPENTDRHTRPKIDNAIQIPWKDNVDNDKNHQTLPVIVSANILKQKLQEISDSFSINEYEKREKVLIVIDEIQFFELKTAKVIKEFKNWFNFLIVGLDKNYTSRVFETSLAIAKLADRNDITFTTSCCYYCGSIANYYEKLKGKQEGVGDEETYRPVCFSHYTIESKTLRW